MRNFNLACLVIDVITEYGVIRTYNIENFKSYSNILHTITPNKDFMVEIIYAHLDFTFYCTRVGCITH